MYYSNEADSSNKDTDNKYQNQTTETEKNEDVKVDKNLLSVEVTLPPSIVGTESGDVEKAIAEAKEKGDQSKEE